jgi:hypothetical protein
MARIEITSDCLKIELDLLDKVWAIHGSLDIPLVHVLDAKVVDEDGWQHIWRKLIGTNAPGLRMAGTYFVDGGLAFLDYGSGRQCVVLQTQHETYKTVIVQPNADQNAQEIVAQILARIKPGAVRTIA